MKLLMFGDVVGEAGCAAFCKFAPRLRQQYGADLILVNGENSAKGNGITPESAERLFHAGADVITTGNHCFRRKCDALYDNPRVLRPANFPEGAPGSGVFLLDGGAYTLAVVNLMGTAYMEPIDNPFSVIDTLLPTLGTKNVFVDFHAEATAEKRAMGYYLAGRVSAVIGTHTHVQTADEEIIDGHTAYLTDAGMVGPERSVLGVCAEQAIRKQRLHLPVTFTEAEPPCMICGVCISLDTRTGKAQSVARIFLRESKEQEN